MDSIVVPLLVIAGTSLVLCNQGAVEILRSPSKVVIVKPDPLPEVRFENATKDSNDTSEPTATKELPVGESRSEAGHFDLKHILGDAANETVVNVLVTGTDGGTVVMEESGGVVTNTTIGNVTDVPTVKSTCYRRDYDDSAAAIFLDNPGDVEHAFLIFNSSSPLSDENLLQPSDVENLKLLNETIVDCDAYFGYTGNTRRLSPGALASLSG